jgi:predicted GIY-YIG superfamily endonuclease
MAPACLMKSAQQRFWPDARPLVERLGRDFFRQLPETAGVYLMRDARESVLYVGKAKNLRHRLCSYRVANPERMARRTLRLLNLVRGIAWEECADEATALNRESELLLEIKPRFNRAGVWHGARRFVAWRSQSAGLELAVLDSATEGWNLAGSFGARAIHLHRALVRLFWCRLNPSSGLAGMPAGWFYGAHGPSVTIPHVEKAIVAESLEQLTLLAAGQWEGFIEWLGPVTIPFEQPMQDEDVELAVKHLAGRPVRACQ